MRGSRGIITSALEAIELFVRTENPVEHAYAGLQDDIARFTRNLLNSRPTGRNTADPAL